MLLSYVLSSWESSMPRFGVEIWSYWDFGQGSDLVAPFAKSQSILRHFAISLEPSSLLLSDQLDICAWRVSSAYWRVIAHFRSTSCPRSTFSKQGWKPRQMRAWCLGFAPTLRSSQLNSGKRHAYFYVASCPDLVLLSWVAWWLSWFCPHQEHHLQSNRQL